MAGRAKGPAALNRNLNLTPFRKIKVKSKMTIKKETIPPA